MSKKIQVNLWLPPEMKARLDEVASKYNARLHPSATKLKTGPSELCELAIDYLISQSQAQIEKLLASKRIYPLKLQANRHSGLALTPKYPKANTSTEGDAKEAAFESAIDEEFPQSPPAPNPVAVKPPAKTKKSRSRGNG